MRYTGLFKRIIPFVITFAAGLFLASFFVSIALPGERWRSGRRANKFHEIQRLRGDNEELREKCRKLRKENEELRRGAYDSSVYGEIPMVPPVQLEEHHPPTPPRRPKHPRHTPTLQ